MSSGWTAFFAARFLRTKAQYSISITTSSGRTETSRFTTGEWMGNYGLSGLPRPPARNTIDLSDMNALRISTSWDGNLLLEPTFPASLVGGRVKVTAVAGRRRVSRTVNVRARRMAIPLKGAGRYRRLIVEPVPPWPQRRKPLWVVPYDSHSELASKGLWSQD